MKDKAGMTVPKRTQTRFVGITYQIHYTPRLTLIMHAPFDQC